MGKYVYTEKSIKDFVKQLRKNKINFFDVPEDMRTDKSIVDVERKLGLRKAAKRGYDVINDSFFVEEIITDMSSDKLVTKNICTFFPDFDSYYLFLDGDIYENSCYYQLDFSAIKTTIDVKRISNEAFEKSTVDEYSLEPSEEETKDYNQAEHTKKICKRWIKRFNDCSTCTELFECKEKYKKTKISKDVDVSFFFFQYIFEDIYDKKRFNVIMEYMSQGWYPAWRIIYALCFIYNPDDVIMAYNYCGGSRSTNYKKKRHLKRFVELLNNEDGDPKKYCYLDSKTHYYCEEISKGGAKLRRYFESFKAFIMYRQGDLTNCDLSNAIDLDFDFSDYKIDSTTKLPYTSFKELTYVERKMFEKGKFIVLQQWQDINSTVIKQYKHSFPYFFDFVAFLKGDLSNADLLFCDGLKNLKDISGLNLSGARLTSEISKKFGIEEDKYDVDTDCVQSFVQTVKNEKETALVLQDEHKIELPWEDEFQNFDRIYYISDLHLMHKIKDAQCISINDIDFLISNIVKNIIQEVHGGLLLIGGDTASDFNIFKLFVKILRKTLNDNMRNLNVIFLLGNHELWQFPGEELMNIIDKYKFFLQEHNMYLLQNDILYKDKDNCLKRITTEELLSNKSDIRTKLHDSRIVIFGGLGFSGYNEKFNANNGIYRGTLDRKTEIEETRKFENIYDVVCETLLDKNLIVFTHTPLKNWCKNPRPQKHIVYINGHTHHNYFLDDGEYRIYADNQVGYHNQNIHLKYFYIKKVYDYFSNFEDGIYDITGEQYIKFYNGKNMHINFNREINILYMLKKNNYYCFIHESKSGSLTILNGGALKKLNRRDIHYYYDNMDKIIEYVKKPLDAFTKFQKQIADEIRKIGGSGTIHGNIIDIDGKNHIYINPIDLKIVGYWAEDIVYKKVYADISTLLREQCPELYDRYQKLLKDDKKDQITIRGNEVCDSSMYFDTDIYDVTREINKLQKLYSNILCTWYEPVSSEMLMG